MDELRTALTLDRDVRYYAFLSVLRLLLAAIMERKAHAAPCEMSDFVEYLKTDGKYTDDMTLEDVFKQYIVNWSVEVSSSDKYNKSAKRLFPALLELYGLHA